MEMYILTKIPYTYAQTQKADAKTYLLNLDVNILSGVTNEF